MSIDALEKLAGWPDNENTFLASGPDGVRLAVAPAGVGVEFGMMAAFDWAYARYGAAFADSAEPAWRLRRWHGCRTMGFADWIDDAMGFFHVYSVILLDGRGRVVDEIGLEDLLPIAAMVGTHNEHQEKNSLKEA